MLPKKLSRLLRITRQKILETCSPGRRCTQAIGLEKLWRQHNSEKRQNPSSIEYVLAWLIGCIFSLVQPTSCCDHDLNHLGLYKLEGQKQKKSKSQKEMLLLQGREPDFSKPFTRVSFTRTMCPICLVQPSLCRNHDLNRLGLCKLEDQEIKNNLNCLGLYTPTRWGARFSQTIHAVATHSHRAHGLARRVSVCRLSLLLFTLDLRKWRRLPYLSMATSTSTK